jgi:hypothetical protein
MVVHTVKKFPIFYGKKNFAAVFTAARHYQVNIARISTLCLSDAYVKISG